MQSSGKSTSARPSILRWAGSKKKLLPTLLSSVPQQFGTYFEPFVGSGALFFSLAPAKAVLGDINPNLIEALQILARQPVALHRAVSALPRTKRNYYKVRRSTPTQKRSRAARFVYLNRLCFNGLYRTNASNQFNVPYGYDTGNFPNPQSFRAASACLKNAKLINGDFEATLLPVATGDFAFLDPPYVYARRKDRREYGSDSFQCDDLDRLFAVVRRVDEKGALFLLSYLDCPDIAPYLSGWNVKRVPVQRQIASFVSRRQTVNELLISNY